MKKHILVIIVVLIISTLFSSGKAYAAKKPIEEDTAVEKEDIDTLTVDSDEPPPDHQIIPPPAPTPPQREEEKEDKRSWTKFTHKKIIARVSEKYKVDPQIIYATIMTESKGNEYAFRYEPSIKDASLCMGQILISTARRLGFSGEPKEMYKPDVCIDLIGKYHRMMLDTYGDLTPEQLARAYNTGSPYKRPVLGHLFRFNMWYYEEG
jgi:hypothetical protein